MGHVQKRGKRWRARFLDPEGAERSQSFARKIDAERLLVTVEADKLRGAYIDTSHDTTVTDAARAHIAGRPHRASTRVRVASLIDTHIAGTRLGSRRLADVRPSEIQAWAADRALVLAPSTMRLLVTLLRSVFAAAVADRLIASSPVGKLSLPRTQKERIVPLKVDQVRALADAMPERCRAMVIAQAGLGLRIGELVALRVQDVDFLRRTVRVEWQIPTGGTERTAPKTPRSRRTVPLPSVVGAALAEHIATYPPADDGSLFTTPTGKLWLYDHYGSRVFAAAVRTAGLPAGTTTHSLRHHYASLLLAAGESVVAVAERLGHENATLVMTTYGHLVQDSEDRTRRAVDFAWKSADGHQTATGER
jgi:integrase